MADIGSFTSVLKERYSQTNIDKILFNKNFFGTDRGLWCQEKGHGHDKLPIELKQCTHPDCQVRYVMET